jgi:hypothetical protein
MNPTLKKVLAAVAVKKGIDKIQEWRNPKRPSFLARAGKTGLLVGAGAGLFYLYKTGRLQTWIDQAKGKVASDEYRYSPAPESTGFVTGETATQSSPPIGQTTV